MILCFYLSLNYVCNEVSEGAKKIEQYEQLKISNKPNFFPDNSKIIPIN